VGASMGPRHTTHSLQARHGCRRTLSAPAGRGANRRARAQVLRAPACTGAGTPRPRRCIGWFRAQCLRAHPALRRAGLSPLPRLWDLGVWFRARILLIVRP